MCGVKNTDMAGPVHAQDAKRRKLTFHARDPVHQESSLSLCLSLSPLPLSTRARRVNPREKKIFNSVVWEWAQLREQCTYTIVTTSLTNTRQAANPKHGLSARDLLTNPKHNADSEFPNYASYVSKLLFSLILPDRSRHQTQGEG